MVRILIAAFVAISALLSANFASAFGLGEITLKSYLNQPFLAEIELREIGDLSQDEIIPKLASSEDFARAGIQRDFFLSQLRFEVVLNENGRSYVKVQSRDPVVEPYIDVLIEFLWPEGRLLREYTVLLDPPTYSAQEQTQQQIPVVQVSQTPVQVDAEPLPAQTTEVSPVEESQSPELRTATTETETEVAEQAETEQIEVAEQAETESSYQQPESYESEEAQLETQRQTMTTKANDTLWSIASQVRPVNSVSVQQTMLAIQELNPDAFMHDNINYLKKNQVLRIPNEDEIRSLAAREAIGIVADQNREWAGRVVAAGGSLPSNTAQLVGSREVTPMELGEQETAKLKLVAEAGEDGLASGSSAGEGSLAGSSRGTEGGASKFTDVDSQVASEDAAKLLSIKDQEIAGLQQELADMDSNQQNVMKTEQSGVIERVAVDNVSAESDFSDTLSEESTSTDEVDLNFASEAEQQAENEEKPAKVKSEKSSPGLFEQTWFLAVIVIVVLAIFGALGFILYRKRLASQVQEPLTTGADFADDEDDGFPNFDADADDGLSDNAFMDDDQGTELTEGKDPVSEAEVYIAYGRHAQAVTLLKEAIAKGNSDIGVKLKLLEVYAALGDQGHFDDLSAQILGEDDSQQAFIDSLAQNIGKQTSASDGNDFVLDEGESEEFDISLDDLANELDADFTASSDIVDSGKAGSAKDALDDLDGALELDDDFLSTTIINKEDDSALDHELDLDLDLTDSSAIEDDFSFDMDDTVIIAEASKSEDSPSDLDFDFDNDEISSEKESKSVTLDLEIEDDTLDLELDFAEEALADDSTESDLSFELENDEMTVKSAANDLGSDELELDMDLDLSDVDEALVLDTEDSDGDVESIFSDDNEDFDLPESGDEAATKLDLARAYIDMGDQDGARDILQEVIAEGDASQKADAQALLAKL